MEHICLFGLVMMFLPSMGLADSELLQAPHRAAVQAVDACIDSEEFKSDPASCAGISYKGCLTFISGPTSHSHHGTCLYDELGIWGSLYRAEVMKKMRWAQRADYRAEWGTQPDSQAFEQVMATETAWNTYRKEQCSMELLPSYGGTAAMTISPLCHIRLTAQRILLLRNLKHMDAR